MVNENPEHRPSMMEILNIIESNKADKNNFQNFKSN